MCQPVDKTGRGISQQPTHNMKKIEFKNVILASSGAVKPHYPKNVCVLIFIPLHHKHIHKGSLW